jgi:large subunit ribosomal protein L3
VQLGFADKPRRLANRAERGHVATISSKRSKKRTGQGVAAVAKPNCEPKRYIREFRTDAEDQGFEVGQTLKVDRFAEITHVDVIGMNKGRGTAGVMKQHNFGGLPASHGVKRHHRAPGSVGSNATDRGHSGKIKKGKRMMGRWGNERITMRNLLVAKVDAENNLILVRGSVPGPNGGYVMVRKTNKRG